MVTTGPARDDGEGGDTAAAPRSDARAALHGASQALEHRPADDGAAEQASPRHARSEDAAASVRPLRRNSPLTVIGAALESRHAGLVGARLPDRMQQLLAMLDGVELPAPRMAKADGSLDGDR